MDMNPNKYNLPPAPVTPEDWECCGSECGDACVFELYRRECIEYKRLLHDTNTSIYPSDSK